MWCTNLILAMESPSFPAVKKNENIESQYLIYKIRKTQISYHNVALKKYTHLRKEKKRRQAKSS